MKTRPRAVAAVLALSLGLAAAAGAQSRPAPPVPKLVEFFARAPWGDYLKPAGRDPYWLKGLWEQMQVQAAPALLPVLKKDGVDIPEPVLAEAVAAARTPPAPSLDSLAAAKDAAGANPDPGAAAEEDAPSVAASAEAGTDGFQSASMKYKSKNIDAAMIEYHNPGDTARLGVAVRPHAQIGDVSVALKVFDGVLPTATGASLAAFEASQPVLGKNVRVAESLSRVDGAPGGGVVGTRLYAGVGVKAVLGEGLPTVKVRATKALASTGDPALTGPSLDILHPSGALQGVELPADSIVSVDASQALPGDKELDVGYARVSDVTGALTQALSAELSFPFSGDVSLSPSVLFTKTADASVAAAAYLDAEWEKDF